MSFTYDRAPEAGTALRLHLNENTAGCSPRVLERLRTLQPLDLAIYPDYAPMIEAASAFFALPAERFVLTNGMDEGILAICVASLQRAAQGVEQRPTQHAGQGAEVIVPVPAFEEYAASASACGAAVVHVPPGPGLELDTAAVISAITPRTRVVFVASPANPTGLLVAPDAVIAIARTLPPDAVLFLDEAYVDFAPTSTAASSSTVASSPACASASAFALLATLPNLVIGRTFSKAFGLAGLRIGALLGDAAVIERVRRVVPPYSLNAFAAAALPVALDDRAHVAWYRREVDVSRALLYEACERHGLEYWPSAANFVLVRVGDVAGAIAALAARGVHVRDRSKQPGCAGCIRITAGVADHTRACLAALEEWLCARR